MTQEISNGNVDLHRIRMKDNIGEAIAEYLEDDNYSSLTFYNDLMNELKIWQDYHKNKLEKVSAMMQLITGHFNTNRNYTEEELNAMCDKAASEEEKEKCREYNLREAEYYNERAKNDIASIKKDLNDFWDQK